MSSISRAKPRKKETQPEHRKIGTGGEREGESTEENEGKSSGGGRGERERERESVQTLIRDSIIELSQGSSFRLHFQLFAGKRSANTGYSR